MTTEKIECGHRCRNTCATLNSALKDQKKIIEYYEVMLEECDDPGMIKFAKELLATHSHIASRIEEKLGEIKANAEILDDIIDGFEG